MGNLVCEDNILHKMIKKYIDESSAQILIGEVYRLALEGSNCPAKSERLEIIKQKETVCAISFKYYSLFRVFDDG